MIFCSLYSGSSGNSIFVGDKNTKILIDAGMSGKHLENALKEIDEDPKKLDGIFITHEHIDHTKGVGILSRKYDIPIYANIETWDKIKGTIGKIKDENIKIITKDIINIKDMLITRFDIPHDAVNPSGYTIEINNKKVGVATDLGHFSKEISDNIKDCDLVLLESNHDIEMVKFGPYPYPLKRRILSSVGHLSNEDCGRAIIEIMGDKQKKIILGHLSHNNNYPDLAYETVKNILLEEKICLEKEVLLSLARRDGPSGYTQLSSNNFSIGF